MEKKILKSKFMGALVGTGIGDALGASFEGRHIVEPQEIEDRAERRQVLTYTDDTHMMIGVAESLIRKRGFDGEDMAHTFISNYELEPFRGYGPGPPRVFRLIKSGEAWNEAAQKVYRGGSFGNGSAMRIAPIGVFYHDDPDKLRKVAYESSQITHAHILGKEGAALQAYVVALATALKPTSPLDIDDFLAKLSHFTREEIYRQKLMKIKELLDEPNKDRAVTELGNGIEAFNSVPAAIYCFLSHPGSFMSAILYAISFGGDTDTIGAMTGAISGAFLGVESIPEFLKEKLEDKSYIEELAKGLWNLKVG